MSGVSPIPFMYRASCKKPLDRLTNQLIISACEPCGQLAGMVSEELEEIYPYWEPPIDRYIGECFSGKAGPRSADFVARWVGAMVVEVHRILIRGGILVTDTSISRPSLRRSAASKPLRT